MCSLAGIMVCTSMKTDLFGIVHVLGLFGNSVFIVMAILFWKLKTAYMYICMYLLFYNLPLSSVCVCDFWRCHVHLNLFLKSFFSRLILSMKRTND